MKNEISELEIIELTGKELTAFGQVEIVYVTAEFQPFSNQQKPDLKFIPNNSNCIFFIEFKREPKNGYSKHYMSSIIEHRDFLIEGQNLYLNYAFATDNAVDTDLIEILNLNKISVFTLVNSKEDLVREILNWVKNEK
jgi:hypothetical protein